MGFLSYTQFLKREGFPPINLPIVSVQGTYFVDNPSEVDSKVVQQLTQAIDTVDGVDTYQTIAGPNFYSVFVSFDETTDVSEGVDKVNAALDAAEELPNGATQEVSAIEPAKFANKYNLLLAVYGDESSSYEQLEQKANKVAEELTGKTQIDSASAIPVIETVTDPRSGQPIERQTSVNRVGLRKDGTVKFYPAISVGVVKAEGVDDIELSETVNAALNDIAGRDDFSDVNTTITADFATTINQQIGSLQSSLIGGLIAVLIVALLLISWRAALVIALFIPTVMAASFLGLGLLGFTLNTITLFALILTLGLFVDDATIMVEAIDSHRNDKDSHEGIIKSSVARVGLASFAGTLTTVLVFTPMLYITGILGSFITLLPITVILALVCSYIMSLTLVPFLSRPIVLRKGKKRFAWLDRLSLLVPLEKRISTALSRLPLLNKTPNRKSRLVTFALVGLSVVAVMGAGFFSSKLKFDIFPQSKDSNVLQAQLEFPPNTTIQQANAITAKLDTAIKETVGEELEYVTYLSADTQSASIEIGLTPYTERQPTSHQIIDDLAQASGTVEGVPVKFSQRDAGPPSSDFPFQMRIYANDPQAQAVAAKQIQDFLKDKELTTAQGSTVKIVETKLDGVALPSRSEKGRFVTVSARFDEASTASSGVLQTEEALKNEFTAERLQALGLSEDALDFDVSQEAENNESFNSIGYGLVIALALMYILLVILYNSLSQPLLIFMAIPFSLLGVFFGLWATDNALSFFVMLGLLGLIGIVVNNTILLTEYANQERDAGADRHTAISNAVRDRFRPLVTTTATTVFALLPLALTDPFWQPLAYTLIFGMISSTLLIITSFPYYYLAFERVREWKNRKFPSLK